jgi:hypothetical protein
LTHSSNTFVLATATEGQHIKTEQNTGSWRIDGYSFLVIVLNSLERFRQAIMQDQWKKSLVSDAEFVGWQKTPTGEVFALYNVKAKQHPLYHSTVSEKTLRANHLGVPPPPPRQGLLRRFGDEE